MKTTILTVTDETKFVTAHTEGMDKVVSDERYKSLPAELRDLDEGHRLALIDLRSGDSDWVLNRGEHNLQISLTEKMACIRGEMSFPGTPPNENGVYRHPTLGLCADFWNEPLKWAVTLVVDGDKDLLREEIEAARKNFDPSYIADVIPMNLLDKRFSLAELKAWDGSPVPAIEQARLIEEVKALPYGLKGLLMMGPTRTSKTTLAAAYLKDQITYRLVEIQKRFGVRKERTGYEGPTGRLLASMSNKDPTEKHDLLVWRIKVGAWLEAKQKWEYRDFMHPDPAVKPPTVTALGIEEAYDKSRMKLPPILWLEELDKIGNPTKTKLDWLCGLLDTVVELNGHILATTNATREQLVAKLTEPVLWRINDAQNSTDTYHVINLHQYKRVG